MCPDEVDDVPGTKKTNDPEEMDLERAMQLVRERMPPDGAYYTRKIAKDVLGISIPATRRYLKILENLGLLIGKKDGRFKVYALSDVIPLPGDAIDATQ